MWPQGYRGFESLSLRFSQYARGNSLIVGHVGKATRNGTRDCAKRQLQNKSVTKTATVQLAISGIVRFAQVSRPLFFTPEALQPLAQGREALRAHPGMDDAPALAGSAAPNRIVC